MALAKPAMNWIIEGRRAIDRDDADAAEAADNARRDALRQADVAARSATVTQLRPRAGRTATTAAGAAALASMAVLGAPQTQAEAAPLVQQDAPMLTQPDASGAAMETQPDAPKRAAKARVKGAAAIADADYEARVADALRLLLEAPHVSNRQVARQSGLSPSSVDRLARTVTPLGSSETTSGG